MPDPRVIVVGTTSEYVDHLQKELPGRLFFLTDPVEHIPANVKPVSRSIHLVHPLNAGIELFRAIEDCKKRYEFEISGVACFDCQSLLLASEIAGISHPFPRSGAILDCRDKYSSKKIWRSKGVPCPKFLMADNEDQAVSFFDAVGGAVVLKPAVLSGSELTFICRGRGEVVRAFDAILKGMETRSESTVFNRDGLASADSVLCEECVVGTEFSSDFIYENGQIDIIRIARKHLLPDSPAGTALAYELPPRDYPLTASDFRTHISAAVEALGIERCMGMADFIIRGKTPYFLEITPRPAGDCLPQLIRHSSGMDILVASIGFSEGRPVDIPDPGVWEHLVGLRIHSKEAGFLRSVKLRREGLSQEILEENWIRSPGDRITLPPEDYQSWFLGHVIFRPVPGIPTSEQVLAVREAVEIEVEKRLVLWVTPEDPLSEKEKVTV